MRRVELKRRLGAAAVEIEDDRITMTASGDANLMVKRRQMQPLGDSEPVGELELRGDGFVASAKLTHQGVTELIETLEAIRDGEVWDDE